MRGTSTGATVAAVIVIVLGFASCDESSGSEAGLYDARASYECLRESHPLRGRVLAGWTVGEPKKVESGDVVTVMMHPKNLGGWNRVDVIFGESRNAADAEFRRWAKGAPLMKEMGKLDLVLQQRANVVLEWWSPMTTRRQIASVIPCLRRSPR